jgi:hypothetical protein
LFQKSHKTEEFPFFPGATQKLFVRNEKKRNLFARIKLLIVMFFLFQKSHKTEEFPFFPGATQKLFVRNEKKKEICSHELNC